MFNAGRRGGRFGGRRGGYRRLMEIPESYNGILRNVSGIEEFVGELTGAETAEIEKYLTEIVENREFGEYLQENRGTRYGGFYGIGSALGEMIYALCRKLRPDTIIETGVSSGISSSYILCALEENKKGKLYSIDLPWGEDTGWIIPDYLRYRWQLDLGRSSEMLPPLIEKLATIDIFFHDSEHSYQNMLWEYETAWKYLKINGILLSHNISHSQAFPDFCEKYGVKGLLLGDMGGIVRI
ncbi:class I SAM-dependent methyltransferase [Chloroflexota bacterium]